MIYFMVVVQAITAVVQAILLYENKNMKDMYIEEQRLAMKYLAELKARLAHAEREIKLLRPPTQELDQQIDEAIQLANQERNINE